MKYLFLFCIIITFPIIAFGQLVNPTIIQQDTDIALHSTDVYYSPFAPPDSTIWRGQLSNEGPLLTNPDGVSTAFPYYGPMVHAARELQDTVLSQWQPCGIPLGPYAVWQRLFQARNKPDGSTSVIIAGGNVGDTVTIGKNEDVDFSASGGVRLESGFHVMPGAFFHAYEEPKWDTAVFSDEFNDSAKFYSQWSVRNGTGGDLGGEGATCPTDTNVRLVSDPDAHDGYALDIIIREDTVDTCNCTVLTPAYLDSCGDIPSTIDTTPQKFIFSSGKIQSCPFPYLQKVDTPLVPAYAHAPYGKYEFRDKIPHTLHHTNNWGYGDYGLEFDLNETYSAGSLDSIYPDFNHNLRRGPFNGNFGKMHDTIIFTSPAAHWCPSNIPDAIVINNVPYSVQFIPGHGKDTVYAPGLMQSEWPLSLANSTGPFTFYYSFNPNCTADNLPWKVDTDAYGKWRIFSAAYHDSSGTLLHFSKTNQPTSVTLHIDLFGDSQTFNCHWAYSLNNPIDSGKLLLDYPGIDSTSLHSFTQAYEFRATDLYSSPGYPMSPVQFNGNDTTSSSYQYHTFAMEWLPHEVRFLVDSVVVRRLPDRLIPVGSPYYDWITTLPRTLAYFIPAEEAIDPGSITERQAFEHAASVPGWPGFEIVDGKSVAHHMLDYVKVWDVPKDVIVPNYPQH